MNAKPKKSKTQSIKQHLLMDMRDQRIPIGSQLPSESVLMKRFSVSRTTVRQALTELSSEGYVEKRQGSGTFRTAPSSHRLNGKRAMLVGVWFNWPTGPLYGPMADGIRDELLNWDYHAIFEGGMEADAEQRGIESLVHKGLDGFIVSLSSDPNDPHEPLREMLRQNMPVVLIDKRLPGHPADLVCTNNQLGAETLVTHLIELGHRRIGFVGTKDVPTVEDRLWGYRAMLRRHGIESSPDYVIVNAQVHKDYGRAAAEMLLRGPSEQRPTALFGANDCIAQTMATVAQELGIKVPDELSIVGFDDAGFAGGDAIPLTTYRQPKYRIGQQAARLLMRRIENSTSYKETILLEGELVLRDSTAPSNCKT